MTLHIQTKNGEQLLIAMDHVRHCPNAANKCEESKKEAVVCEPAARRAVGLTGSGPDRSVTAAGSFAFFLCVTLQTKLVHRPPLDAFQRE